MEQDRVLQVLEFTKMRERLANLAVTAMGADKCRNLTPYHDFGEVLHALAETEEAAVILRFLGGQPMVSFEDVRESLNLAAKGATLSPRALLDVAGCLRAARAARTALVKDREDTPILSGLAGRLTALLSIEQEISDAIMSEEEIADRASAELYQIRRQIRTANEKVREKLNSMIRSTSFAKNLQDNIVTMRGDRYCIPVKQECRANVPGLVHDQSSSGATLFIEPMAVVELGNDLKQFQAKEQLEIARILQALSAQLVPHVEEIHTNIEILNHLDFAFAKGQLARELSAAFPKMNQHGYIKIVRGRHPLIDADKVVPSDLWMGDEFTTLIITGPNTGGKTVTLKTVGLFTLMAQAGLHVPADLGTELAVFDRIYADIGDEQSIEQSLSTFSSHMKNIVEIMQAVTPQDLVLFDELGAGTDPTEGAALAQSILSDLLTKKVRTMATTHYSELKAFALAAPGVENASAEFDVESLRPTYRLSIGIPGKSNAFAISQRLGLPDDIIEDAKSRVNSENAAFEEVLENLERSRMQIESDKAEARIALRAAEDNARRAQEYKEEIEREHEKAARTARREAERILQDARNTADSVISELSEMRRAAASNMDWQKVNAEKAELFRRLNESESAIQASLPAEPPPPPTRKIVAGDRVKLNDLGTEADVISVRDDGVLTLRAGVMTITAREEEVRLIEGETAQQVKKYLAKSEAKLREMTVKPEIDLRGMMTDEAIPVLERFLDNARMAKLEIVTVIHGKGTGAVRKAVHTCLRREQHIKSFRLGRYGEGEDGVTIVELK